MSEAPGCGIRIQQLTKTYGRMKALNRVDLDIQEGEYITIVGPNGAGKSTLLGIIAGLIRPTRGQVWVDGQDAVQDRDEGIGRKIGVLSYHAYLYDELSVEENLRFYGALYDVARPDETIAALLSRVGMSSRAHSLVKTLSRGMRQRVALARALLHDPPVLLLDEPYVGLDQEAIGMLQAFLSARRRTVLLVTHDLHRGLEVADRLVIMTAGRIAWAAPGKGLTLSEFERLYRQHTM
jgi:heme exporter protein A